MQLNGLGLQPRRIPEERRITRPRHLLLHRPQDAARVQHLVRPVDQLRLGDASAELDRRDLVLPVTEPGAQLGPGQPGPLPKQLQLLPEAPQEARPVVLLRHARHLRQPVRPRLWYAAVHGEATARTR